MSTLLVVAHAGTAPTDAPLRSCGNRRVRFARTKASGKHRTSMGVPGLAERLRTIGLADGLGRTPGPPHTGAMKTLVTRLALLAAAAFAASPALAQQAGPPGSTNSGSTMMMPGIDLGGAEHHYTPEEKERFEKIDSDYKRTMQKVPDKKASSDPWANMRQGPSR